MTDDDHFTQGGYVSLVAFVPFETNVSSDRQTRDVDMAPWRYGVGMICTWYVCAYVTAIPYAENERIQPPVA